MAHAAGRRVVSIRHTLNRVAQESAESRPSCQPGPWLGHVFVTHAPMMPLPLPRLPSLSMEVAKRAKHTRSWLRITAAFASLANSNKLLGPGVLQVEPDVHGFFDALGAAESIYSKSSGLSFAGLYRRKETVREKEDSWHFSRTFF